MEKAPETDINLHVVAVFAWIEKGDLYLMAQRNADDPQAGGDWALVGGKMDNEIGSGVIEETLRREIREEVGVEIEDQIEFLASQAFVRSSGHHVVSLIFKTTYKSGEAKPLDGQQQVKWMTKAEISELIENNPNISYLAKSLAEI